MKMKLGQNRNTVQAVNSLRNATGLTKKLQMNIPEELHKSFKMACLKADMDMTEVTTSLIKQWLKERGED